jgi:hypothetical protein
MKCNGFISTRPNYTALILERQSHCLKKAFNHLFLFLKDADLIRNHSYRWFFSGGQKSKFCETILWVSKVDVCLKVKENTIAKPKKIIFQKKEDTKST